MMKTRCLMRSNMVFISQMTTLISTTTGALRFSNMTQVSAKRYVVKMSENTSTPLNILHPFVYCHSATQDRKTNLKQTWRPRIVRLHLRETTCVHFSYTLMIHSKICCFLTTSLICLQEYHLYMTGDFYRRWRTINVSTCKISSFNHLLFPNISIQNLEEKR